MDIPCECGNEPPGSISHGVSFLGLSFKIINLEANEFSIQDDLVGENVTNTKKQSKEKILSGRESNPDLLALYNTA